MQAFDFLTRLSAVPGPRTAFLTALTLGALHAPGSAGQDEDYSLLVFDPVALALEEGAQGEVVAREVGSLPDRGRAVEVGALVPAGEAWTGGESPSTPEEAVAAYEQAIRALEAEGGPYEYRLAQELLGLGSTLQQLGEHQRALEIFERANHVNRINQGLFNLEQSSIIEKEIESYLALGDLTAANDRQEYLFYVQKKALGEGADLLPALTALAEWNIFAFNARMEGASASLPAARLDDANSGSDSDTSMTGHLVSAQSLYQTVIRIIREESGTADPRLLDLERRLAITNYFFAANYAASSIPVANVNGVLVPPSVLYGDLLVSNSLGYRHGRDALERRVRYLREWPERDERLLARALADLGDWLLMFKKRASGVATYQEGLRQLPPEDDAARKELFRPAVPVALPTFIDHRYSREALGIPAERRLRYKGHIDVAFYLNRYGQTGDVRVLDRSPGTPEAVEARLLRDISRSLYRPRFFGEGPPDQDTVTLRYYFTW